MAEGTNQSTQMDSAPQHLLSAFPRKNNPSPLQKSHVASRRAVPEVSPIYWRKAGSAIFVTYTSDSVTGEKSAFIAQFSPGFLACCFHQTHFFQCAGSHLHQSINTVKVCFTKYAFPTAHKKWEGGYFVQEYDKMSIFFLQKCKSNLFSVNPPFWKSKYFLFREKFKTTKPGIF